MDRRAIWEKWKTDYDFKTLTGSGWSLAVTLVFALYHGYLGIAHHSGWYGSVCVYYLMLAAVRFVLLDTERRVLGKPEKKADASRRRTYRVAAGLLLVLNLALVAPVTLMVLQQRVVDMSLIPAISIAAYTTYRVTMASINQWKKRKRSENPLVKLLRSVNLIDALVAVLTLQNTLIMVNGGDADRSLLPVTAASSFFIWGGIVVLSVLSFADSLKTSAKRYDHHAAGSLTEEDRGRLFNEQP